MSRGGGGGLYRSLVLMGRRTDRYRAREENKRKGRDRREEQIERMGEGGEGEKRDR